MKTLIKCKLTIFLTGERGLPGEPGALPPTGGRIVLCLPESRPAVLQEAPGDVWVEEEDWGEHPGLRVPETVALIVLALQTPGQTPGAQTAELGPGPGGLRAGEGGEEVELGGEKDSAELQVSTDLHQA